MHTSKRFEEVKREIKEAVRGVREKEDERLEETLEDVKRRWSYYSAFFAFRTFRGTINTRRRSSCKRLFGH